jgi:ATP-dependent exoDNAse (exonuclease V) beta subunit
MAAGERSDRPRDSDTFYCPVFGVKPAGYDEARDAEKAELDRERIRLWYVAATRARELLVLPRLDAAPSKSAWISLRRSVAQPNSRRSTCRICCPSSTLRQAARPTTRPGMILLLKRHRS